jgi:radical SAM superfamily enzyme YgiQ (UPF0313 family)
MPVLLVSTYDLGRQPFGLASPAASLRTAGVDVECVDASRDRLEDDQIRSASAIAFYLPMHTATRLAAPLLERVAQVNPSANVVAYGLYAPLNGAWLRARGVRHVLGPEAEDELVALLATGTSARASIADAKSSGVPRVHFLQPDRSTLPPLARYAAVQMPDGTRRVAGNTDATRGCKHLCRHCPIVPVYRGAFRAVPLDVVMADIRAQVAAGAEHITFGDPDFFNGPGHARKLLEQFAAECPQITYDVTIKIEHLLAHADMLPLLTETGCLFVTSAVESVDDAVLEKLRKRHTRADFARAVSLCRQSGVTLVPTFVAFTPWTTLDGYVDMLNEIAVLELTEAVAPIQLAIRLLITAESALLELPEVREGVEPYDPQSLTWPWRHADRRVDDLQQRVMQLVVSMARRPRSDAFDAMAALAHEVAGTRRVPAAGTALHATPPYLTEGWYCCAEPGPEQFDIV